MLLDRLKEERPQIHSLDGLYFEYTKKKLSLNEESGKSKSQDQK
jgi:hypothetical protein